MAMSMVGALDADGTLATRWSLGFEDMALLNSKPANAKLGLAVQLMFYRATGRFGRAASEFPDAAVAYLAEQIGAPLLLSGPLPAHAAGRASRPKAGSWPLELNPAVDHPADQARSPAASLPPIAASPTPSPGQSGPTADRSALSDPQLRPAYQPRVGSG